MSKTQSIIFRPTQRMFARGLLNVEENPELLTFLGKESQKAIDEINREILQDLQTLDPSQFFEMARLRRGSESKRGATSFLGTSEPGLDIDIFPLATLRKADSLSDIERLIKESKDSASLLSSLERKQDEINEVIDIKKISLNKELLRRPYNKFFFNIAHFIFKKLNAEKKFIPFSLKKEILIGYLTAIKDEFVELGKVDRIFQSAPTFETIFPDSQKIRRITEKDLEPTAGATPLRPTTPVAHPARLAAQRHLTTAAATPTRVEMATTASTKLGGVQVPRLGLTATALSVSGTPAPKTPTRGPKGLLPLNPNFLSPATAAASPRPTSPRRDVVISLSRQEFADGLFKSGIESLDERIKYVLGILDRQKQQYTATKGSLNPALSNPATTKFTSKLGIDLGDELLSQDQSDTLSEIDKAIFKTLDYVSREEFKSTDRLKSSYPSPLSTASIGETGAGKADVRLATGAGKSHLTRIIKEKYKTANVRGEEYSINVLDINPNSSPGEVRKIFGSRKPQDRTISIVNIDELFFSCDKFNDIFLELSGDRSFEEPDATRTPVEQTLFQERIKSNLIRKLRINGHTVIGWGASESVEKVENGEILRIREKKLTSLEKKSKLEKERAKKQKNLDLSSQIDELITYFNSIKDKKTSYFSKAKSEPSKTNGGFSYQGYLDNIIKISNLITKDIIDGVFGSTIPPELVNIFREANEFSIKIKSGEDFKTKFTNSVGQDDPAVVMSVLEKLAKIKHYFESKNPQAEFDIADREVKKEEQHVAEIDQRLVFRQEYLEDLKKRRDILTKTRLTNSTLISKAKTNDRETLTLDSLITTETFGAQLTPGQKAQYILPDYALTGEKCTDANAQTIMESTGAEILIIPVIDGEGESRKLKTKVFYHNGEGFVKQIFDESGLKDFLETRENSQKSVLSVFAGNGRQGHDAPVNAIGGDYGNAGVGICRQIIHCLDVENIRDLNDLMQYNRDRTAQRSNPDKFGEWGCDYRFVGNTQNTVDLFSTLEEKTKIQDEARRKAYLLSKIGIRDSKDGIGEQSILQPDLYRALGFTADSPTPVKYKTEIERERDLAILLDPEDFKRKLAAKESALSVSEEQDDLRAAREQEASTALRVQEQEAAALRAQEEEAAALRVQEQEVAALRAKEERDAALRVQEQEAAALRAKEERDAALRVQEQEAAALRAKEEQAKKSELILSISELKGKIEGSILGIFYNMSQADETYRKDAIDISETELSDIKQIIESQRSQPQSASATASSPLFSEVDPGDEIANSFLEIHKNKIFLTDIRFYELDLAQLKDLEASAQEALQSTLSLFEKSNEKIDAYTDTLARKLASQYLDDDNELPSTSPLHPSAAVARGLGLDGHQMDS